MHVDSSRTAFLCIFIAAISLYRLHLFSCSHDMPDFCNKFEDDPYAHKRVKHSLMCVVLDDLELDVSSAVNFAWAPSVIGQADCKDGWDVHSSRYISLFLALSLATGYHHR